MDNLKAIGDLFAPLIVFFTHSRNLKVSVGSKFGSNNVPINVPDGIMTLFDDEMNKHDKNTLHKKLKGLMPYAKKALEGRDWIKQLTLCKYADDSKTSLTIRNDLRNENFEFDFYKAWAQVIMQDLKKKRNN
ncbi:MAG: hypothetical protein ACTSYC_11815 [Promethearchaeota archaeon]